MRGATERIKAALVVGGMVGAALSSFLKTSVLTVQFLNYNRIWQRRVAMRANTLSVATAAILAMIGLTRI